MKTTLTKTRIMILLAVFLAAPLLANLPCVTGTCTGEGSCRICGEGKTGASGKDMSRSLPPMRVPGAGDASNGSLQVAISFGNVPNEHLSLPAEFSVYARDASPLVFSPQLLQYRNPLCERIAQIDIAPGREAAVLGNGWQAVMAAREGDASYVRLLADADGLAGFTHQVRLPAERRGQLLFRFRVGEAEALPYGELSTSGRRLAMRASDGSPTTSVPAFYDLLEPDGCVVRYDAAHGDPLWLRTAQGRTVTPAAAGMEAIFDADGIVRQVRSSADGLADIVPDGDNGYELRFYAPSQVLPKTNGLYGADGTPHTVWRVSRPVAGSDTRVDVTRTSGGTSRTWEFEYSRNSEDWVLRRPGGLSDESRSTTTSPDGLLKTTLETTRTPSGAVASRTETVVRVFPFGSRMVSKTLDPDGAALASGWEYWLDADDAGSYGRIRSATTPDGGWDWRRYDANGRETAVATPWKDAASGAVDGACTVRILSYTAHDARDTVAANDSRPRTEETRTLGVTTSKTFHAYYMENGCAVEVEERCGRAGALYGDADNLRTVWRFHPAGSAASSGRLHTVLRPDGLAETFEYASGAWTPSATPSQPGSFTEGVGASLRVTTYTMPANGVAIPHKSVRKIAVYDAAGDLVHTAREVWDGTAWRGLDWTESAFDGLHRKVSERDSRGRLSEWTWSCCAKASETDWSGAAATFAYDTLQRLSSRTLWSGETPAHTTSYAYDAADHVLSTTVSGGGLSLSKSSTYDLSGRVVSSTDEAGLVTSHAYSHDIDSGNIETVTRPGGATTVTSYYRDGHVKSVTGTAQVAEYYDYGVNADGSQWTLVRVGAPASPRWTKTTTDMLGNAVKVEKPGYGANAVILTQNFYDAAGRLVKTTRTGSADILYEYDALGELFRTGQDADGNGALDLASNDRITETASSYLQDNDDAWWLRSERKIYATTNDATPTTISVTDERLSGFADGVVSETRETDIHGNTSVTTVLVDRANATVVTETLSPESSVAERQVAVDGLVVSLRSKSDLTTIFSYDGLRRRVSMTHPRTGTSTVTYNAAGQVSAETDAAGNTTSYGYDDAGRLAWKRNALGKCSRYSYNPRGQQIRVWGDAEYPVEYGYDQYGQKVTMTTFRTGSSWNGESWPNPTPQGDTTTWNYDAASGLVLSKVYADGYGPSYTYTTGGKLATRTWARKDAQDNDLVTTYSYNLFGELIGIDYSDSTPDITYSYNRVGKLSQVTDVVGTRTFAYNATLDEISETITGLYSKTLTRTYTGTGFKGRKQGLSIDNVSHYSYGYDTYGRMNQITIPSGSFNYTRLANSDLVAQMTRPNGITTTWSYEADRDLVTQVQNGTISTYGYVNDAVGRRTSMSRSGSTYANPDTIAYTYNDRSELTGAVSNVDTTYSYSYVYDPIGNRVTASEAGVSWTYTTNSLNQYTSATENNVQLNFGYDLDGNMTYRPVDATSGWTQIWNGENRMVETFKGSDRLTFKYDYMGRRVEKCVYNGNTLASRTLFVYDGFKCVEELDGLNNNTVLMRHTCQPFDVGLDVIFASTDVNGTSYFLHDANKNVMQNINSDGSLLENYIYAPFGNNVGTYNIPNIGFSSEITEKTLGISYYNYRYYLLSLGRWNKRDPIEEKSSNNLYLFINNSINNKFDHLGQVNIVFGPDENVSPNDLCCLEYMDMWMFEGYASESDCLSKCASSYYAGQLSTSVISLALGICSSSPNPVTTKTCAILSTFIGGYSVGITIGCIIACEMNICRSYSPPEKYNYIGRNWYFKKVCKTRYRCPAYRDLRD